APYPLGTPTCTGRPHSGRPGSPLSRPHVRESRNASFGTRCPHARTAALPGFHPFLTDRGGDERIRGRGGAAGAAAAYLTKTGRQPNSVQDAALPRCSEMSRDGYADRLFVCVCPISPRKAL